MSTRRCSICALNWPITKVYEKCPECGELTSYLSNDAPMPASDAQSRLNHAKFEQFYEERETTRGKAVMDAAAPLPPAPDSPPPGSSPTTSKPDLPKPPFPLFPPGRHATGRRGE